MVDCIFATSVSKAPTSSSNQSFKPDSKPKIKSSLHTYFQVELNSFSILNHKKIEEMNLNWGQ